MKCFPGTKDINKLVIAEILIKYVEENKENDIPEDYEDFREKVYETDEYYETLDLALEWAFDYVYENKREI